MRLLWNNRDNYIIPGSPWPSFRRPLEHVTRALRVLYQSASCWNSFATMFADVKNSSRFSCIITDKSAAGPQKTESPLQQIVDQLCQRKSSSGSLKWVPSRVQNMISVKPGWYTHRRSQEEEINLELGLRAVYGELGQMSHVTSATCSGRINTDSFSGADWSQAVQKCRHTFDLHTLA